MSVEFCGLELAHPIINGSGTFDAIAAGGVRRGAGEEFPFAAYVSKTITLEPRAGNPPPRLWEAPAGLINSIGLPNKGLERLHGRGPARALATLPVPLITNVMGSTAAEIARLVEACDVRAEIAAIELNVSCPNVKTGLDIGADPRQLGGGRADGARKTGKPLIVKLTPNTADVAPARWRRRRRRRRGVADQHAAGDGARAACQPSRHSRRTCRVAPTMAGRWHRRPVRSRDPRGRARPGRRRRRARAIP
jgi:dihydroorotate dehydrogenase